MAVHLPDYLFSLLVLDSVLPVISSAVACQSIPLTMSLWIPPLFLGGEMEDNFP